MIRKLFALALLASSYGCTAAEPAYARNDDGKFDALPEETKAWFRNLKQPDNPAISCCGEADAYWADSFLIDGDQYVAVITDERTELEVPGRVPRPVGTRIVVPNYKLKYDEGNPTGHGIIFLGSGGQVYCFLPPGGV